MSANNKESLNKIERGQAYTALPDSSNHWVTSSIGNDGEVDYYRDVFDDGGQLSYCYGEHCELEDFTDEGGVKLFNKSSGEGFWITQEQFVEDFALACSPANNIIDEIVSCIYCHTRINTALDNFGVSEEGFAICEKCEVNG